MQTEFIWFTLLDVLFFIFGIGLIIWGYGAIDRYHMRCAIREATAIMRRRGNKPTTINSIKDQTP